MDFLKNGTKVEILGSGVIGTIVGICIRGIDNVTVEYNVQWIVGGSVSDSWFYSYNVKEYVDTKQKAGMVNYETGLTTTT